MLCLRELETTISTHPSIEKDPFETGKGRSFDEKLQIADWTGQVNASPSFNNDEVHTEMSETTPAPAVPSVPSTAMNVYLTDKRGNSVYMADPQNNDQAIANATTESWPPFTFLQIDLEHSEPAQMQSLLTELRQCWQTQGEKHLDTLRSLHDLAEYYANLGRNEKGMQLMEKTVGA